MQGKQAAISDRDVYLRLVPVLYGIFVLDLRLTHRGITLCGVSC